jgi:DNA-binding MarR family transcriptional regulator
MNAKFWFWGERSVAINSQANTESEITLGLLKAVQDDKQLTQRSVASDLGIALGLVNTYLKRCVSKGFVKIRQVPRNRYAYYLTPQGFAEKSRLTAEYLSQSFSLFRQSQSQFREIFSQCSDNGWNKVAFYGAGDLSEIAALCSQEFPIEVVAVIRIGSAGNADTRLRSVESVQDAGKIDAVILTDLNDPQCSFDTLAKEFPSGRILTAHFLEIYRNSLALKE